MDIEDEDDLYDWYTFENAITRLSDESSQLAKKTMVHALAQAGRVGLVENKWGGIFGDKYLDSSDLMTTAAISTTEVTSCCSDEECGGD